jgi:hypothetical protein
VRADPHTGVVLDEPDPDPARLQDPDEQAAEHAA